MPGSERSMLSFNYGTGACNSTAVVLYQVPISNKKLRHEGRRRVALNHANPKILPGASK